MMGKNNTYVDRDKEISLKGLILNLWYGKWIIAIVTVVCLVLGALYTFFIADKVYQSKATVSAKPDRELDYTMETYAQNVKSPDLMQMVAENLEMKVLLDTGVLSQMTSARVMGDTDIIEILVKNQNPDIAKDIANAVAESFIVYMPRHIQTQAKEEATSIQMQLDDSFGIMEKQEAYLARIYNENEGLYNIENEIAELRCQLTDYQVQIESDKNNLILEETYLSELSRMTEDMEIKGAGETDDIDTAYAGGIKQATLMTKIAESEAEIVRLKSNLSHIPEFVLTLEALLQEKEELYSNYKYTISNIKASLTMRGEAYDELKGMLYRTNLKADSNYGVNDFKVVSYANIPVSPISPNNKMNMLIAFAIGIILGVAVIMFRAYILDIKKTSKKERASQGN